MKRDVEGRTDLLLHYLEVEIADNDSRHTNFEVCFLLLLLDGTILRRWFLL